MLSCAGWRPLPKRSKAWIAVVAIRSVPTFCGRGDLHNTSDRLMNSTFCLGEYQTDPLSFGALATFLSIASSVKNLMTKNGISPADALDLFKKSEVTPEQKEMLAQSATTSAIANTTVISQNLLDQLAFEADQCERKHIADRKGAVTPRQSDQADADAKKCMCAVLRSIQRHNGNIFPDPIFESWWKSYGCQ
jgi:hypothetical protein